MDKWLVIIGLISFVCMFPLLGVGMAAEVNKITNWDDLKAKAEKELEWSIIGLLICFAVCVCCGIGFLIMFLMNKL